MSHGEFWAHVTNLVHLFDGRVTSGPRSASYNAELGGVPESLHLAGLAADVVIRDRGNAAAFGKLASRLGIRVIDEGDHFHLQPL